MIKVSGNTFAHRMVLSQLGGRFDRLAGCWVFKHLSDRNIARLIDTPGLRVLRAAPPKPAIYGDDERYFNYFAPQDPLAFFGFSSIGKFANYIEALPAECRSRQGWDGRSWHGTDTMREAIDLARNGWHEGADMAEQVRQALTLANPPQRVRKPSLAGGTVNVGRLLAGDPLHMTHRTKLPGRKIITFFVEIGCNSNVSAKTLIMRAAVIAATIDIMESSGYSCNVVAVDTSFLDGPVYQLAVMLKDAGERLNMSDLAFGLGHPAFSRRFSFAAQTSARECEASWEILGGAVSAFTKEHPCRPNEFYVEPIDSNVPSIQSLIPVGLPLEINA